MLVVTEPLIFSAAHSVNSLFKTGSHCVALASLELCRMLGLNTYIAAQAILLTLNSEIASGFQADMPYLSASVTMSFSTVTAHENCSKVKASPVE